MNKDQAIKWIKEIQSGNFNPDDYYNIVPKGNLAKNLWHKDVSFRYGLEYGVILALIKAFGLEKDEHQVQEGD